MDWILNVKSYVKVVEEGSFNGAARELNTTSSAISKRVNWLEERIGTQLLKRTTRSISQTEAVHSFTNVPKISSITGSRSLMKLARLTKRPQAY